MKSQSFEYQLRRAVPPSSDPQAKARAVRAAVEEFERVQARRNAGAAEAAAPVPAVGAPSRSDVATALRSAVAEPPHAADAALPHSDVAAPLRPGLARGEPAASARLWSWWPKPALLGGLASACVVVVGASVYWLMPAEQRTIHLHRAAVPEVTPRVSEETMPAGEQRPVPTGPRVTAAEQGPRVAPPRSEPKKAANPATAETEAVASAPASDASADTSASTARASADITERPVPRAPSPAPAAVPAAPPAPSDENMMSEVQVTGTKLQRQSFDAPSPITTLSGNSASVANSEIQQLQESVVTASRLTGRQLREAQRAQRAREKAQRTSSVIVSPPMIPREVQSGDKFKHFDVNPVKRVKDAPISTFSIDVDTSSYSFIRRQLASGTLPPVDSVRVEEMINYFDYAWPTPESRDQPFEPTITVSDSPWGEGKKLIHIGIKGYALPVEKQPDVNLVLLLDVSGSMASPDKLPLAQQSMALLLDTLKPTDTVGIVVYAGAAGMVLAPTPVREKDTILQALNSLRPGGSTAGAEGIRLAYELAEKHFRKDGVNRILLATDGDFNVGISNEDELKGFIQRERQKGVFLSVLGFGVGNYHDETAQVLAQNGNGAAAYIDSRNEAKKVLVQQSTGSLFTIAKDVKLQVEFNPSTVAEYRLVGYETRALATEDFNNDKVDAGDVGAGHTVTAIYEITPVGSGAELIGERRYAAQEEPAKPTARANGQANEYGFLKIRYKLPNGFRSRLMEQPILVNAGVPASLRKDVEFATAVAGFGQLLRGGAYTGELTYDGVMQQAEDGLSNDPHGYRREFIEMVRQAAGAEGRGKR